jgi:Fe2+ or Zn2+ uptake regulation protein
MATDLHASVAERLQAAAQRYTRRRRALVDVLEEATRPLTIQEILAQSGIVHRVVSTDDFARYELAEHLTEHHHHHLICSQCGQVDDFTVSADIEEGLAAALGRAADEAGFTAHDHRLDLIGQCRRCA